MAKSKLSGLGFCLILVFIKFLICLADNYENGVNLVENAPKLIISYPEYTGLNAESYEIDSERLLSDYVSVCESKLKSLFGVESGSILVVVNGFELDKSELSYPVENFIVSRNENVKMNIELKSTGFFEAGEKDKTVLQNEAVQNVKESLTQNLSLPASDVEKEGILMLRFISHTNDELLSDKVPASLTVKRRFPVTNWDLLTLISEIVDPSDFEIESISPSNNENVNLLDYINETNKDSNSGVSNGNLLFVKLREIGKGEKVPLEGEIIPVRVVFHNKNIANRIFRFASDTKMSEVVSSILLTEDPETGRQLTSDYEDVLLQNEEGTVMNVNREANLKSQVPSGQIVSESRPLVFFLTLLPPKETEDSYPESQDQDEQSKVFDTNNEIENEIFKLNSEILNEYKENVGFPEICFTHEESGFEMKLKTDPTFTTFASLYSQAQLIWSTINIEHKEKNCLLLSKRSSIEEEIMDPNKHETLVSNSYYNGMKLIMKNPRRINITVGIYINNGKNELEFTKRMSVNIPEVISVMDFLTELNRKHRSELSKYLIIGLQRKQEDDNLVEYLPDPKTPSSITYLSFYKTDSNGQDYVLLEVERVKKIDILLLLPFEASGEEITDSVDKGSFGESRKEVIVEYKLTILSNTSVRDLVNNLIKKRILKRVSQDSVSVKDSYTKKYLKNDHILGHYHSSLTQKESGNNSKVRKRGKDSKSKLVFEISISKYMELSVYFYYPQGEGYINENLNIKIKRNKTIRKLKEMIVLKAEEKGMLEKNLKIGIGSGYDLGNDEFTRVVYSIISDGTKLVDSGLSPTDDKVRAFIVKDKTADRKAADKELEIGGLMTNRAKEANEHKPEVSVLERVRRYKGTVLEVPLSLENCPLNTLLERRWFIVPMTLDIPLGELKIIVDEVAALKGVEFSLFAETEKGKIELDQTLESCSSLGITEIGLLNAVCIPEDNLKREDMGVEKSLIQAIMEDNCIFGDSKEKCELAKDVEEDLNQNPNAEKIGMYEEDGETKKSLELLEKIDKKIKNLEEKELKMKKNRKMIQKMKKKDDNSYKKNLLSGEDLDKLLKEFIKVYVEKGVRGLNAFCKKQGSEKIEQLIMYISTPEGKSKSKKAAKEIGASIRRNGRVYSKKNRISRGDFNEDDIISEVEYSALPELVQFSDSDSSLDEDYSEREAAGMKFSKKRNKGEKKDKKREEWSGSKSNRGRNGDLDPVTFIESGRKKGVVSRLFSRVPLVSSTVKYLYSHLTKKGRRKKRVLEVVRSIRSLEIKFRKKAYGGVQENEDFSIENFDY
ncbi:hypothetical protein FG386_003492 [Cryptosporidium ryanae]|uniref:uncharacterized protein n=1 Tax=Cryptosporidium ryanae TaxID=515981 RepID=UPI00351A1B9D|nr:hypothetical protein FG386_003492 [Cryptosporidium ryanae]